MRPNPLTDSIAFLLQPGWPTPVFWLLIAASLGVAAWVWYHNPTQRSARHCGIAAIRLIVGIMWWEQSLWKQPKSPPDYDGLIYWMKQMVEHAAIPLQGDLVRDYVLPNIAVFGPLVFLVEVAIGVSLMLGLLTRWGALLGFAMAGNLWLGLYSAPGEWPWTYFFLVLLQAGFAIDPPGRSLGVEAALRGRVDRTR